MVKTPSKICAAPAAAESPCEAQAGAAPEEALPVSEMRRGARRLAARALDTLEEIMSGDGQASAKLAAAREVLDRGYGPTTRSGRPAPKKAVRGAEPYTVVVQRFSDPPDPKVEDFD